MSQTRQKSDVAHLPEIIENADTLFCGHILAYEGPSQTPPHSHNKTQILYASKGIIRLKTPDGIFVIPPSRALWIPPHTKHSLHFSAVFESTNLYLADTLVTQFPQEQCRLIVVDNLVRELLIKATQIRAVSTISEKDHNFIKVMLDCLTFDEGSGFYLPRPVDERLLKVVAVLENDISDNRSFEELAKLAGASPRTLSRLFQSEMNMNFKGWRGQLRVFRAIELLAMGRSVTDVAFDVGFEGVSSFVSYFKKLTGKTPAKYF